MPPADAGPTQKAGSILSAGLKQKPQAVGCLLESKRQLAADPRLHPSPLLQTRSWLFKARSWRSAAGLAPGRGCGRPDVLKRKFRPAHIATQSGSSTGSQVSAPAAPQRVWQAEFAMPRGRPCALRRRDEKAPAPGGAVEAGSVFWPCGCILRDSWQAKRGPVHGRRRLTTPHRCPQRTGPRGGLLLLPRRAGLDEGPAPGTIVFFLSTIFTLSTPPQPSTLNPKP